MATSIEIMQESLKQKLLSVLTLDDFWKQFMEVVGEEMALERDKLSERRDLFNVYKQMEDGLLNIAETFGYVPNLIVDHSLQVVRKEVESIPYRIRNKTVYDGYYVNFKQISQIGEIYNFYWSGRKLIRAVIYDSILQALSNADLTKAIT